MTNASENTASVDVDSLRRGESISIGQLTIEGVVNHDDELLLRISYKGRSTLYTMEELQDELVTALLKRGDIVIRDLDLPDGQDYVWFRDSDVLAVSSRLDEAGRERVVEEARRTYAIS